MHTYINCRAILSCVYQVFSIVFFWYDPSMGLQFGEFFALWNVPISLSLMKAIEVFPLQALKKSDIFSMSLSKTLLFCQSLTRCLHSHLYFLLASPYKFTLKLSQALQNLLVVVKEFTRKINETMGDNI